MDLKVLLIKLIINFRWIICMCSISYAISSLSDSYLILKLLKVISLTVFVFQISKIVIFMCVHFSDRMLYICLKIITIIVVIGELYPMYSLMYIFAALIAFIKCEFTLLSILSTAIIWKIQIIINEIAL